MLMAITPRITPRRIRTPVFLLCTQPAMRVFSVPSAQTINYRGSPSLGSTTIVPSRRRCVFIASAPGRYWLFVYACAAQLDALTGVCYIEILAKRRTRSRVPQPTTRTAQAETQSSGSVLDCGHLQERRVVCRGDPRHHTSDYVFDLPRLVQPGVCQGHHGHQWDRAGHGHHDAETGAVLEP